MIFVILISAYFHTAKAKLRKSAETGLKMRANSIQTLYEFNKFKCYNASGSHNKGY